MRIFLNTSIIAMVLAGIYGFADFAIDAKNGTLITYEDEKVLFGRQSLFSQAKMRQVNILSWKEIALAMMEEKKRAEEAALPPPPPVPDLLDLTNIKTSYKYFSRGEYIYEPEVSGIPAADSAFVISAPGPQEQNPVTGEEAIVEEAAPEGEESESNGEPR